MKSVRSVENHKHIVNNYFITCEKNKQENKRNDDDKL